MVTGEHTPGVQVATATSVDTLTDEEVFHLTMLQQRCGYQPLFLELGMDLRRLEFARWLAQHGILNEGLESEDMDSVISESQGMAAHL